MTASPALESSPLSESRPIWPLWQRLGFRYLLCHWLLYALPMPFSRLVAGLHRAGP